MGVNIAKRVIRDDRFNLVPYSLTGPEILQAEHKVDACQIELIQPERRDRIIGGIVETEGPFVTVDFTHPSAVNRNAEFYCRNALPFVMGTTGGDRDKLESTVSAASISAVIAPNMAKQIVGFQAIMAYAAESFPDLFKGYTLHVRESHQQGKADTSGTAKAIIRYFNALGVPYTDADVVKERVPDRQQKEWGIPEKYLGGHAWHTYSLDSEDKTVHFEFTHNVNGREVYVDGTLDAVVYLHEKMHAGITGTVFSMIDVLKGA
jgi:4-hydroxy-tetrahydrodipicolinate reductase